jgi:iron complex outermembrane receptor protein
MKIKYLSILIVVTISSLAHAADTQLDEVVVSVNKTEQKVFDAAASVSVINRAQIQDSQPMVSMSESAAQVPGLYALNRQNYAQDVMISSRGFGSNSAFGARAVKIYVDGIPATIADGQGQTSHIDLASAERIEVLRGPFSSMYGNSAGGVIQVFSEKGKPGNEVTPYASYGSFGTTKYGIKASGDSGQINYLIDSNRFDTNGSREHSGADRNTTNAKLAIQLGSDSQLTIIGNSFKTTAQDPLGLSLTAINSGSQAAGYNANAWNSVKSVEQNQGGFEFAKKISAEESIKLVGYYGQRNQEQYQAAGLTTKLYPAVSGTSGTGQAAYSSVAINGVGATNGSYVAATNVLYSGGLLTLDRSYYGFDAQGQKVFNFLGFQSKAVLGTSYDRSADKSMSYCTSIASGSVLTAGCTGPTSSTVNANANYGAYAFDQYAQLQTYLSDRFTWDLGLRHANVTLTASDNVSSAFNRDRTYSAILPMTSLSYSLNPQTNVYTSVGRGLDTPTLNQIKYTCGNVACTAAPSTTPNFLDASVTNQVEIGVKQKIPGIAYWSLALFQAETYKEIMSLANVAGKNVYTNANHTQRKGIEWFGVIDLPYQFSSTISYTYLLSRVTDTYPGTSSILAGSYIPGVPRQKFFADIAWRKPDQSIDVGLEMIASSGLYANDLNTAGSEGYTIFNFRAGLKQKYKNLTFTEFVRVNNFTDKYYVGSVIVNQKDNQFYEPAPGRNWIIGAKANYKF